MKSAGYSKIVQIAATFIGLIVIVGHADAAKLYKWVDEDGIVHYSDRMPPDQSKMEHEELDDRGLSRREVERAETEEERMAKQMEQALAEQQRKIKAEKQARQRMRDQNLLRTFTTERDLLITRDDRLNMIDSTIAITVSNNNHIVSDIEDIKKRISGIENSGREVPENLTEQLSELNESYEKNKEYIEMKQQERKEVSDAFESDLERFRELKGIVPDATEQAGHNKKDENNKIGDTLPEPNSANNIAAGANLN